MTATLQLVGNDPTTELTVAEAAVQFGVSPTTIRRRLNENPGPDGRRPARALPHAHQDRSGVWMIPIDDLKAAQFKSRSRMRSRADKATGQVSAQGAPPAVDALREQLAHARQRAAVAEAMAGEARRELTERLAEADEAIRTIRATVESQNATIATLTREVEDRDRRLALMDVHAGEAVAGPVRVDASSLATEPDEDDPVPVGELRRRLADQQPPPRRWWQRMGRR